MNKSIKKILGWFLLMLPFLLFGIKVGLEIYNNALNRYAVVFLRCLSITALIFLVISIYCYIIGWCFKRD